MIKVTLLNYTPDALDLLLYTKQTRLAQTPGLLDEIKGWPYERKMKELDYMLGTIHSSWEFVNYTFHIDGVTRAFTHQLVRTRHGSYAQQSQRTVDMSGFNYVRTGALEAIDDMHETSTTKIDGIIGGEERYRQWLGQHIAKYGDDNPVNWYDMTMDVINLGYQKMTELGVPPQDARGVLPTNIVTNIVAAFNLRTLSDMAKLRLCTRTQGEYQDVFRAMRAAVLAVHPWAEPFIRVHCAATGVCAFPNYHECPIKGQVFNPATGRRWDSDVPIKFVLNEGDEQGIDMVIKPATADEIQQSWERIRFEATPRQLPVVDNGRC